MRSEPESLGVHVNKLRELRRKAREIYRDVANDLRAFQHTDGTFSTLPPPNETRIHVTTTCTALMALAAAGQLESLCPSADPTKSTSLVVKRVVEYAWESEGLETDNAFSVALVMRATGYLARTGKIKRDA